MGKVNECYFSATRCLECGYKEKEMEGHIWVWITWHTVLNMTFIPHNLTIIILIIYLVQFSIILLSNIETPFFRRLVY
jgi:hypothetical protein